MDMYLDTCRALHKHIIDPPSLAIHADADIVSLEHAGSDTGLGT